ncbi:hypothetical protein D9758_003904 [Tetrapyrgos nigripes]|uniref:Uncharacterized protein n=1 Tax=Tetrapyrgos nigripes TaxID=182062 RepID=A0A8H5GLK2_9AGAR|nr:hypothetical protein D9758_003904 [Tetrapyrgos nigripes]
MPVSFCPAPHPVESVWTDEKSIPDNSAAAVLKQTSRVHHDRCRELLQSSFHAHDNNRLIGRPNGLVMTLSEAWSYHYAVSIRPDDVWITILTQFSLFVNANAEDLRCSFVAHPGQKDLVVKVPVFEDYGVLATRMTELIHKNVTDPSLVDWILPKFSTTEPNDIVVSSVVMMATMKKYFRYYFSQCCGIPKVTLEGKKKDWELLLKRIEKLKEYGKETTAWYHLLRPVLARFVRAFDEPDSERNLLFWQKIANFTADSGAPDFSGWLTAFCAFDADGKFIGDGRMLQSSYWRSSDVGSSHLVLDGAIYHRIEIPDIPPAFVDVNVTLRFVDPCREEESIMVAGMVGTRICDAGLSRSGRYDLLKPVAGWWIFLKQGPDRPVGGNDDFLWFKVSWVKQWDVDAESILVDADAAAATLPEAGGGSSVFRTLKRFLCSG